MLETAKNADAKKIYLYKLTSDNGGAPCICDGTLSLAICKPRIRSVASEGSVLLGFAGNRLYHGNCIVYVARITKKVNGRTLRSPVRS